MPDANVPSPRKAEGGAAFRDYALRKRPREHSHRLRGGPLSTAPSPSRTVPGGCRRGPSRRPALEVAPQQSRARAKKSTVPATFVAEAQTEMSRCRDSGVVLKVPALRHYRPWTLSLYGALRAQTGEVADRTARRTGAELVRFLRTVAPEPICRPYADPSRRVARPLHHFVSTVHQGSRLDQQR